MKKVKEEAIKYIKNGNNLERWKEENIKLYLKRQNVLKELEVKLNSQQPSEKKVSKLAVHRSPWEVGDEIPNLEIIEQLSLLKDPHPLFKHMIIWEGIISFNSRELKKLNFEVIKTDDKYKKKEDHLMSVVGIGWSNIHNLDFGFIQLLEYAEKNKTLIDDTK